MQDKVRVSLVIQSNLSNAIFEMGEEISIERLQFVKYLIHYYSDTQTKINVDFVYEQFRKLNNK
jgi:hypothetical protein